jgi:hypothetical protein
MHLYLDVRVVRAKVMESITSCSSTRAQTWGTEYEMSISLQFVTSRTTEPKRRRPGTLFTDVIQDGLTDIKDNILEFHWLVGIYIDHQKCMCCSKNFQPAISELFYRNPTNLSPRAYSMRRKRHERSYT